MLIVDVDAARVKEGVGVCVCVLNNLTTSTFNTSNNES